MRDASSTHNLSFSAAGLGEALSAKPAVLQARPRTAPARADRQSPYKAPKTVRFASSLRLKSPAAASQRKAALALRKAFQAKDHDRNGKVTKREFRSIVATHSGQLRDKAATLLSKFGEKRGNNVSYVAVLETLDPNQAELARQFVENTSLKHGSETLREALVRLMSTGPSHVVKAFTHHDAHRLGTIGKLEFRDALLTLEITASEDEFAGMWKEFVVQGRLDYISLMAKLREEAGHSPTHDLAGGQGGENAKAYAGLDQPSLSATEADGWPTGNEPDQGEPLLFSSDDLNDTSSYAEGHYLADNQSNLGVPSDGGLVSAVNGLSATHGADPDVVTQALAVLQANYTSVRQALQAEESARGGICFVAFCRIAQHFGCHLDAPEMAALADACGIHDPDVVAHCENVLLSLRPERFRTPSTVQASNGFRFDETVAAATLERWDSFASQLTDAMSSSPIRPAFEHRDKSKTGFLRPEAFRGVIEGFLGTSVSDEHFERMVRFLPVDQGRVSYLQLLRNFDTRPAGTGSAWLDSDVDATINGKTLRHSTRGSIDPSEPGLSAQEVLDNLVQMSKDNPQRLRVRFSRHDKDTDGMLDTEEFQQFLQHLGLGVDRLTWATLVPALGFHSTYPTASPQLYADRLHVSFNQLMVALHDPERIVARAHKPVRLSSSQAWDKLASKIEYDFTSLQHAFFDVDLRRAGVLTKPQFRKMLTQLDIHVDDTQLARLFKTVGADSQGLSYLRLLEHFGIKPNPEYNPIASNHVPKLLRSQPVRPPSSSEANNTQRYDDDDGESQLDNVDDAPATNGSSFLLQDIAVDLHHAKRDLAAVLRSDGAFCKAFFQAHPHGPMERGFLPVVQFHRLLEQSHLALDNESFHGLCDEASVFVDGLEGVSLSMICNACHVDPADLPVQFSDVPTRPSSSSSPRRLLASQFGTSKRKTSAYSSPSKLTNSSLSLGLPPRAASSPSTDTPAPTMVDHAVSPIATPVVVESSADLSSMVKSRAEELRAELVARDPRQTGMISSEQLEAALVSLGNLSISQPAFNGFKNQLTSDREGNVSYGELFAKFGPRGMADEPLSMTAPAVGNAASQAVLSLDATLMRGTKRSSKPAASVVSGKAVEGEMRRALASKYNQVSDAIHSWDPHKTGFITRNDLRRILQRFCFKMTDIAFQKLLHHIDSRKDGDIKYQSFLTHYGGVVQPARRPASRQGSASSKGSSGSTFGRSSSRRNQSLGRSGGLVSVDDVHKKVISTNGRHWGKLKKAFKGYDWQNSGLVSKTIFSSVLVQHKIKLSNEELGRLCLKWIDSSGVRVRYMDFIRHLALESKAPADRLSESLPTHTRTSPTDDGTVRAMRPEVEATLHQLRGKLKRRWKEFRRAVVAADKRRTGKLPALRFRLALQDQGVELTDDQFFHLMDHFDADVKGTIAYDQFLRAVLA